jgi:hypothetical protein
MERVFASDKRCIVDGEQFNPSNFTLFITFPPYDAGGLLMFLRAQAVVEFDIDVSPLGGEPVADSAAFVTFALEIMFSMEYLIEYLSYLIVLSNVHRISSFIGGDESKSVLNQWLKKGWMVAICLRWME